MVELGQLEKRYPEFAARQVQVVAVSNDDQETAQKTHGTFPHLTVIADAELNMARAFEVIHEGKGPWNGDTNAPTTFLVDATGKVCWVFRPERFITRLSPDEVLAAVDETWPSK
jgi:peroxiredoxin